MSSLCPSFLLSTHSSCLAYRNLLSGCHVSVCPFYFLQGCSKLILLPRNRLKPAQPTKIEQQCVCQNIFRCICCYPHYIILPSINIESMETIVVVSSLESTSHHSNGQPEPCVHLRDRLLLFKELISPKFLVLLLLLLFNSIDTFLESANLSNFCFYFYVLSLHCNLG